MTALELLAIARRERPHVEYATNGLGNAIAARRKPSDEWEMVAAKMPDNGEWVTMGNLFINGEPCTTGFSLSHG